MPWLALIQAGVGMASEQQKQDDQKKQAAVNARYSPWTGVSPGGNQIQSNGALQGAIQGGAAGMAQAQNSKNSDAWQEWMQRNGSPDKQQNVMPVMSNNGPGFDSFGQQAVPQSSGYMGSSFPQSGFGRRTSGWSMG